MVVIQVRHAHASICLNIQYKILIKIIWLNIQIKASYKGEQFGLRPHWTVRSKARARYIRVLPNKFLILRVN